MNHQAPDAGIVPRLARSVSRLGLGGHEYAADGRLKGFGDDDLSAAVRPGYRRDDFGGPDRKSLVAEAVTSGVEFFDVTIDPEVAALGACLPRTDRTLVQARPQGMCYRYDPGNPALVDYPRLRAEVERLTGLIGEPGIDVLNLGIEAEALESRPDYLARLAHVITQLKEDRLIRYAACDSLFSGVPQYEKLIASDCFDLVWISFGPLDPAPAETVFDAAADHGMGIIAREVFAKGAVFGLLGDAGLEPGDSDQVAAAAIRWVLQHPRVTTLVVGARDARQLRSALAAAAEPHSDADREILGRLLTSPKAAELVSVNRERFLAPSS